MHYWNLKTARATIAILFMLAMLELGALACIPGGDPVDVTGTLCGTVGAPMDVDTAGMPHCKK
jgi:hypothetical protein